MSPESIFWILMGMVIVSYLIVINKAELPDSKEIKKTRSRQSSQTDTLSSSLNDSLNELSKSENQSKRAAKKRKDFIHKHYKIIASFYNNYKFIDYTKKINRKTAKKQMLDIVNILDKNLEIMEDFFAQDETSSDDPIDYKIILIGIITFRLMKKETLNEVSKDLKKLYLKGEQSEFPMELMTALEKVLTPLGYLD
jgi:hypothetical protein